MTDKIEIFLEKAEYFPGETINGRVECNFSCETKAKALHVTISGEARVYWKAASYTYRRAQEIYFEMAAELLGGETTFPQGLYTHNFKFTLPADIPPSMSEGDPSYSRMVVSFVVPLNLVSVFYGSIEYTINAVLERPWALNYESKRILKISSSYDLNHVAGVEKPFEFSVGKRPTSMLLKEAGPISIYVKLPQTGYVASQVMSFAVQVKNESTVDIQYVQFKFVQGFVFQAEEHTKRVDALEGDYFVLKESSLATGNEKSWKLDLKVPLMLLGNFTRCNIIKIFWELRGEVCLPFPSSNILIHVPITLGSVPIKGTM